MAKMQGTPNESGQSPDTTKAVIEHNEPTKDDVVDALKKVRTSGLREAVAKQHIEALTIYARRASTRPPNECIYDNEVIQLIAEMLHKARTHLGAPRSEALIELLELELREGRALDAPTRRMKAAAMIGVSPSSFERRRERPLLEDLGKILFESYGVTATEPVATTSTSPQSNDKINVRPLVPKAHEAAISTLSLLVSDAIRLAELCETYLATRALDAALEEINDKTRLHRHRPALMEPMWRAYRDLLLSSAYCLADSDSPAGQQVARYVPQDVLVTVEVALAEINSYVGVDETERRLIFRTYTGGIEAQDIRTYRKHIADVYNGWWWDFAEGEAYHWPDDFDKSLKAILDACRALHKYLRNYVQDYLVGVGTAKEKALSAAANYYGADLDLKMSSHYNTTLGELLDFARPGADNDEPFSLRDWARELDNSPSS
jgi:hypothetical protein